MGVPGFFAWILKRYRNNKIILNKIDRQIKRLYIDANCLFHPQSQKVVEYYKEIQDNNKLENKIIKRIINYINFLIKLVNPEEVYIAVDGVAPMAKMNQQRKRRYKSVYDARIREQLKDKYNIKYNKLWNNTKISPGTEFMENLHNKIIEFINKTNVKITYSSYHTNGEGEHKILQDIKINNDNNTIVIYGLDADLIFLSLASNRDNIYLLREASALGKKNTTTFNTDLLDIIKDVEEELNFISIDKTKEYINQGFIEYLLNNGIETEDKFIDDFIFISYLIGNDFLPHIPSLDIKTGGMDYIVDCYIKIYTMIKKKLINREPNININMIFLEMLINELSKNEDYYFKNIYNKYVHNLNKKECMYHDPYEKDVWEIENEEEYDIIKLGEGNSKEYKYRYYETYIGVSIYQQEIIDKMCKEYCDGLKWVIDYYFNECKSWEWQYRYSHGPFISDINMYIKNRNIDINKIEFKQDKPIDIYIQLLSILPPENNHLLPENYRKLMISRNSNIIDIYPIRIKLDRINKDQYYKCIPYLPIVDVNRIKKEIEGIEISYKDKIRNKQFDNYKNFV